MRKIINFVVTSYLIFLLFIGAYKTLNYYRNSVRQSWEDGYNSYRDKMNEEMWPAQEQYFYESGKHIKYYVRRFRDKNDPKGGLAPEQKLNYYIDKRNG